MLLKILGIIILCIYLAINLITAKVESAKSMKRYLIDGQCLVGKIFANIFYAPAWFLKGVKFIVLAMIA